MAHTTFWTVLAFGTLWFWAFIGIITCLVIFFTEDDEDNGRASLFFVLGLAGLYFLGNSSFFNSLGASIINNPWNAVGLFIAYIALGSIWSVIKWFFYLKKIRAKHIQEQTSYSFSSPLKLEKYTIEQNKNRVLHWMLYWPLSALWTLINDPFKKAFEYVISHFGKFYNKMSVSILGDLSKKPENEKK